MKGYYRFPSIHKNKIAFVSEDDLWLYEIGDKKPIRLTSGKGFVSSSAFSPDGKIIAFSSSEEGNYEIYIMPSTGGKMERLTYLSATSIVIGWTADGKVLFRSNAKQDLARSNTVFTVDMKGNVKILPYGMANHISFEPDGKGMVLGRNTADPARWKRYKGGTAGKIWIDKKGDLNFKKILNELNGNFTCPIWINKSIYFISDHEGIANLYSSDTNGKNIKRHTSHKDYYVRNAISDGKNITYQSGGDIYIYDVKKQRSDLVKFEYPSAKPKAQRKFINAAEYLEYFNPSFDGKMIAFSSRGTISTMENFEGPVYSYRGRTDARYRLPVFLKGDKKIVFISDESGEEKLFISDRSKFNLPKKINADIGRVIALKASPKEDKVVLINHRQEIVLFDLKTNRSKIIHKNIYTKLFDVNWSPDGKYLTYSGGLSKRKRGIFIYDIVSQKEHVITNMFSDHSPCFSPDGKYLYFIGTREFDPVYDRVHFELGFPRSDKIYVISLKKDIPSPIEYFEGKEDEETLEDMKKGKKEKEVHVKIDLKGIDQRISEIPLPLSRYSDLGVSKKYVLALSHPIEGALSTDWFSESEPKANILAYDIEKKKTEVFFSGAGGFELTSDKIFIYAGKQVRVFSNTTPVSPEILKKTGKEGGVIDISRSSVFVEPVDEWKQMFKEAWRLQRDNFWTENMSNIDWELVLKRYLKLVERLSSRAEFSDLIWEMQGELGTSHCYEFGGDYIFPPNYGVGLLGGEFKWDETNGGYTITEILKGDPWSKKYRSPLQTPGTDIEIGDVIKSINGIKVKKDVSLERMLLNHAGKEIELIIFDKSEKKDRKIFLKTAYTEIPIRYRQWVEKNRAYVHKKTKEKIGYVHIPDMGAFGYSEFHRYYLTELDHDGLIVDVRFNGGGNVSPLILEKLARKIIGFDVNRWGQPETYPYDTVAGPIVILTNEHAGSDGDIFSHSAKLFKIGKLIGTRTWGGVIGISPSHFLADRAITTQPEYSFWFKDVGWNVENYGTDPDIEVEITPKDYSMGKDPQLDRGIEEVLKDMKKNPPLKPDFKKRPNLKLPELK